MPAKSYGQIWQDFRAAYGDFYRDEHDLRAIHLKWRRIAALVGKGRKGR